MGQFLLGLNSELVYSCGRDQALLPSNIYSTPAI